MWFSYILWSIFISNRRKKMFWTQKVAKKEVELRIKQKETLKHTS